MIGVVGMERKKAQMRHNGIMNVPDIEIEYKGFKIKAKLDMGKHAWLSNGNSICRGYIVVKDHCLTMPGGAWAHSVIEAKAMIDILIEAEGDAKRFWSLLREAQGLSEYEYV